MRKKQKMNSLFHLCSETPEGFIFVKKMYLACPIALAKQWAGIIFILAAQYALSVLQQGDELVVYLLGYKLQQSFWCWLWQHLPILVL